LVGGSNPSGSSSLYEKKEIRNRDDELGPKWKIKTGPFFKTEFMKEIAEKLKKGYEDKKASYIEAARILENTDEELFAECIKKAAGCGLMIDEYKRMLTSIE